VDGDSVFAAGAEAKSSGSTPPRAKYGGPKPMVRDCNAKMMSDWKFSESPLGGWRQAGLHSGQLRRLDDGF